MMGKITIPRIDLSAVVVEGDDDLILRRAVGHIPGTALPDDTGTVGLAGHRDTFFRGLGLVRENDIIVLETLRGTYRYRVADTAIVEPNNIDVLRSSQFRSLVLVTCYPFHFVGSAPQRYIVTAWLVDGRRLVTSPTDSPIEQIRSLLEPTLEKWCVIKNHVIIGAARSAR